MLARKMGGDDQLHVITTHPNRYATHRVTADDVEMDMDGRITIHRIAVPDHKSGMLSQARSFVFFALGAFRTCYKIKPDFLLGTTSRLWTGVLTWFAALVLRRKYYLDLRDIFSETISDIFSKKSSLLSRFFQSVFSQIDKRVFVKAVGVNVVSEGFLPYFNSQGIDTSHWSFYPNGVDQVFMGGGSRQVASQSEPPVVLYAGNIGSGQGLETIIPAVATELGEQFRFRVIGDGGTRDQLEHEIAERNIGNIELLPPVSRDQLIRLYEEADIFFLHLNDLPAFKRVLPSKIFEYAAMGKPIVAGLNGYSAQFVQDNIPYGHLFSSGDVDGCIDCLRKAMQTEIDHQDVERFVGEFSRERIMESMAGHIHSLIVRSTSNVTL